MEHHGGGHGGMEHGGHSGMPGMDHGVMGSCSMNMVWNYATTDICILSSSWRITTPFSLYLSLATIVALSAGYELLRLYIRNFDARLARNSSIPAGHRRRASLLPTSDPSASSSRRTLSASAGLGKRRSPSSDTTARRGRGKWIKPLEMKKRIQIWRSSLYALSVGSSFLLMLIAMTFNAYIIAAIVTGAGLGHYLFNRDVAFNALLAASADDKGLACHS